MAQSLCVHGSASAQGGEMEVPAPNAQLWRLTGEGHAKCTEQCVQSGLVTR